MNAPLMAPQDAPMAQVSRRRYQREQRARTEAEQLLEQKSRELYGANKRLQDLLATLELAVKERTRELNVARVAAESANEAKSVFLASMSHEIRTPLNGILGMAQALDDSGLTEDQHQLVTVLRESGGLLLGIINDVLDISKIEAGKLEIETVRYNLVDLVRAMQGHYQLRAEEKGLSFDVQISKAASTAVLTDPTRLQQVAGNLLSNAIKFTETGSVSFVVDLETHHADQLFLTFIVRDTGPGIDKQQQARLFQRFSQANSSVTRLHGGTGLGLAISRNICELMGGTLRVLSNAGQGAEFRARVCVGRAETLSHHPVNMGDEYVRSRLEGIRVLAAEDNRTNQLVLKHMLKSIHPTLVFADNGRQAVRLWEEQKWDLVLMDINMPEMDGVEATHRIRQLEREKMAEPIPILAVSANAMAHQVADYIASGMSGHVAKPISKSVLLQAMASSLDEGTHVAR